MKTKPLNGRKGMKSKLPRAIKRLRANGYRIHVSDGSYYSFGRVILIKEIINISNHLFRGKKYCKKFHHKKNRAATRDLLQSASIETIDDVAGDKNDIAGDDIWAWD